MKKNQTENEYEMINSNSYSQINQLETLCGAGTLYNCEKNRKLGDFFSLLNKKTDIDKLPFPEENKQRSNRNQMSILIFKMDLTVIKKIISRILLSGMRM
jgi:hypothetical protein